jgi:crotonobetainyl-CoA:carnitine CoA-transferase CaiB-like acyl-CoA transferase
MDRPDLAAPEHPWGLRASREAGRDVVNGFLEAWLCSLPSRDSALALLQRHRVPVGPVLGVDEVARDPALREVGSVRSVTDPVLGLVDVPGFPLRFSEAEVGFDLEAPFLGEHNRAVVVDMAGRAPAEYDALVAAGVLQAEPVDPRPSRQR